mgnify:CR=1 FL=1
MTTTPLLDAELATPTTAVHLTIGNSCSCRFCPTCSNVFSGHTCVCGAEGIPNVDCYGCIADACEHVGVIAQQWYMANPKASGTWGVQEHLEDTLVGMDGPWEQRWTIEPWTGGRMQVEVVSRGQRVALLSVTP